MNWTCKYCGKSLSSEDGWFYHEHRGCKTIDPIIRENQTKDVRTSNGLKCKYCNRLFSSESGWFIHQERRCFRNPGFNKILVPNNLIEAVPNVLPVHIPIIPADEVLDEAHIDNEEVKLVEGDIMLKEKEKEAKELKIVLDEDVKKQKLVADATEKNRKDEIRDIVKEVIVEIKEKEKEVKKAEQEVKLEEKKNDVEKVVEKKDELDELKKELADLRKEHAELLIKLNESNEERYINEQATKRGLVQMFGKWKSRKQ